MKLGRKAKAKPIPKRPESGIQLATPGAAFAVYRQWDDGDDEQGSSTTLVPVATRSRGRPRLTVMSGIHAGRVVSLDEKPEYILGRSEAADIRIEDSGVSREHCRIVHRDGLLFVQDLDSRNGTILNGDPVAFVPLNSGDRIHLGPSAVVQIGWLDDVEDGLLRSLYEASTRDPLTGAFNRRYFFQRLELEVGYARRHGTSLGVLMIDVDHFKSVNDTHGHAGGDLLLCAIRQAIADRVRAEDMLTRYGGEEFALLLRETPLALAFLLAERIRLNVERLAVPHAGETLRATVSIGVADLGECDKAAPAEALVKRADERMYRAKSLGRNRVCSTDPRET